jgi:hypothetical protein
MEFGTIKAARIYVWENRYVTADLELNVKGVNYSFGGEMVVRSGANGGGFSDIPYLGRFLFRCLEICNVPSWDLLKSRKVQVKVENGKVTEIGNVAGDLWFNPRVEFEMMKEDRQNTGHSR